MLYSALMRKKEYSQFFKRKLGQPQRYLFKVWASCCLKFIKVSIKVIQKDYVFYPKLCADIYGELLILRIKFIFIVKFWLVCCLAFLDLLENFRQLLLRRLAYKRVIFLQTKLWGLFKDYMCKTILFRIIHSRNKISKLSIAPWKTCRYMELEIQNAKTWTTFLKGGKYLKNERFLLHLSKFIFSELKPLPVKPFSKGRSLSVLFYLAS